MERKLIHPLIAMAALAVALPATADLGPGSFSYEGRVYESDGNPSTRTVNMRLQVLNPAGDCVLRDEVKSGVDLSATGGTFAVSVGTGTTHANDPGNTIANIYRNSGSAIPGRDSSNNPCNYSPTAGAERKLRIWVDGVAMTPDISINSVPYAVSADHLRGKAPSDFVSVNSSTALTQVNLENVFGDASKLANLVQIAQGNFTAKSASAGVALPSYSGDPSTPVAGSIWFDSTANQLKYKDGSSVQVLSGGGGGVTSVTAGSGLQTSPGGGITATGSISIAAAGVVSTMLADGSVVTTKIADASVTSQKIMDGTIGTADLSGSLSINTTGNITSNLSSTQTSMTKSLKMYESSSTWYAQIQSSNAMTANYTLTLPLDDGNSGQVLATDGSGVLTWTTPSGAGDFKADGTVPMTGQLQANSSGTYNLPQVTFGGDTDAGLYRSGADEIGLATSGTSRLHVAPNGRVGVGTISPQSALHVLAADFAETFYGTPAGGGFGFKVGIAEDASLLAPFGYSNPANTAYLINESNNPIVFSINNTMPMIIKPDGSVEVSGGVKIGNAATCGSPNAGTLRYNVGNIQYCNGSIWQTLSVGGGALTGQTLTSGTLLVGNGSNLSQAVTPSGDVTMANNGMFTVQGLQGRSVASTSPVDGQPMAWSTANNRWEPVNFGIDDLKTQAGAQQFSASCMSNQTLTWSAITDAFTCTNIAIDASAITTGTFPAARLGGGSPSAMTYLRGDGQWMSIDGSSFRATDGSAAGPGLAFQNDGTTGLFRPISGSMGFSLSGTEKMRLGSGGRLGIGGNLSSIPHQLTVTSSGVPTGGFVREDNSDTVTENLEVVRTRFDSVQPGAGFGGAVIFKGENYLNGNVVPMGSVVASWENTQTSTGSANSSLEFSTSQAGSLTSRMSIKSSGNVGIGTTLPAYTLHVVGNAGLSSGTSWTNASDVRLKDVHGDYEYGLSEILKLHTVRFNYKKGNVLGLPSDHRMTGFIAQEVQKVIPDAVKVGPKGYLELNVDPIHWATVNAVQELYGMCKDESVSTKAEVSRLKASNEEQARTISSLKSEVESLRERMERLEKLIEKK